MDSVEDVNIVPKEQDPSELLTSFIYTGLELIKNKEFKEAIKHFRNKNMAKTVGFAFREGRAYIVTAPQTPQQIERIIEDCAYDSSFMHINEPIITFAVIDEFNPAQNPNIKLPEYVYQNVALGIAEEWTHGIQYLKGGPIAGYQDPEIDVAFYFMSKGVQLTENFLKRHGRNEYPELISDQ